MSPLKTICPIEISLLYNFFQDLETLVTVKPLFKYAHVCRGPFVLGTKVASSFFTLLEYTQRVLGMDHDVSQSIKSAELGGEFLSSRSRRAAFPPIYFIPAHSVGFQPPPIVLAELCQSSHIHRKKAHKENCKLGFLLCLLFETRNH